MVSRRDLHPGAQAVQAAHALADFAVEHPALFAEWHKHNYLVFLSAADEQALVGIFDRALSLGVRVTAFREPDMDDALTAVCLAPSQDTRRITSGLPLLLKNAFVAPIGQSGCALTQRVAGSSPAGGTQ